MDTYEVIDKINSRVSSLGLFDMVLDHEPKSAPDTDGHVWACWVLRWRPLPSKSGLAVTSMRLDLQARVYRPFLAEPQDSIDRDLLGCVDAVIRETSADVSFGIDNKGVWTDLLGDDSDSSGVRADLGYLEMNHKIFRIADVSLPVVMTDYFPQARTDTP